MIICGDFNIDLKNCNICKNAEIFLEKCHELGCSPMINRPTRIDLNKNYFTIIDNFFTNLYCAKCAGIIISDLSDHFPIILSLDINKSNRLHIVNTYNTKHNLINDVTVYHFSNFLKTVNWNFFKTDNSETSWNLFIDFCIHKFNIYCPIYENRKYKKKCIPWNTKDIKKNVGLNKNFMKNIN